MAHQTAQQPEAIYVDPRVDDALDHHRTTTGLSHRKLAMWLFLGSECMFFGGLIGTFLIYQNNVTAGATREEILSSLGLVSIMAFVLLLSSFTMVLGLNASKRGDQKMFTFWILATAFCGLFFIASQGFEFYSFVTHEHITPRTNLFAASFMILTGFHGAHVTLGIVWLLFLVVMVRLDPHAKPMLANVMGSIRGVPERRPDERLEPRPRHRRFVAFVREQFSTGAVPPPEGTMSFEEFEYRRLREERSLNVEIAGLYWHFVDIVWVVLFAIIYLFT